MPATITFTIFFRCKAWLLEDEYDGEIRLQAEVVPRVGEHVRFHGNIAWPSFVTGLYVVERVNHLYDQEHSFTTVSLRPGPEQ